MLKLSLHHGASLSLGHHLKRIRQERDISQSALTRQAQITIPTLRLLETGQGSLLSFWLVLEALKLEITGRNLPAGATIGDRLTTLRKRKRISQRELVKLVGVSQPTLVSLERSSTGRLQTLDRVLVVLGAGAYLAAPGSVHSFFTHAGNSSTSMLWETPHDLLAQLYGVFGRFDLDPCSPTDNGRSAPVKARVHYTASDNGLALPWFGTTFVNPPYGRSLSDWTAKARREYEQGNAAIVIALLPARPDTAYWHRDIANTASVLFLKGRLKFGTAATAAPFPSCLAVWGASDAVLAQLQAAFPEAWLSRLIPAPPGR